MTDDQGPGAQYIHRQHDDMVNPNGATRFMRAAGEARRRGIASMGMPMASEVVVKSLDGTVLRIEPSQQDGAKRPTGLDVAPVPAKAEPEAIDDPTPYDFEVAYRYAQLQADLPMIPGTNGGFSMEIFGDMVGCNHTAAHKWRSRGYIPREAADRVAVRLGVHPMMLWPEWIADGLVEADRYDSEPSVRREDRARRIRKGWNPEEPTEVDWRTEFRRKRDLVRKRDLYVNDEAYRAEQIEKSRERYEANKETIAEQRKTYRQRNKRKILAQQAEYRKLNKDEIDAREAEYRKRPEVKERRRLQAAARYKRQRDRLLEQQRVRDRASAAAKRAAKDQAEQAG